MQSSYIMQLVSCLQLKASRRTKFNEFREELLDGYWRNVKCLQIFYRILVLDFEPLF